MADSAPGDMGQEHTSTLDERSVFWVYIQAPGPFQHPRGTSGLLAFTYALFSVKGGDADIVSHV